MEFKREWGSYVLTREKVTPEKRGDVTFAEDGTMQVGTSVRGDYQFQAHSMQSCKVCGTIAPTFLARTKFMKQHPMRISLDGEWALLDWFARRSWGKTEEHGMAQCIGGTLHEASSFFELKSDVERDILKTNKKHLFSFDEHAKYWFSGKFYNENIQPIVLWGLQHHYDVQANGEVKQGENTMLTGFEFSNKKRTFGDDKVQ